MIHVANPCSDKLACKRIADVTGKEDCKVFKGMTEPNEDNRIIFSFGAISFTIPDAVEIYNVCKDALSAHQDSLDELYRVFEIKPKNKFAKSRVEITNAISEYLGILENSVEDRSAYLKEIRRARRKFIYWGDVNPCVYGVIDRLHGLRSNRKLVNSVPRDRDFYNQLIECSCYLLLLDTIYIKDKIEDDKLFKYKADYDYVDAIKRFEREYHVNDDLTIDTETVFSGIYSRIADYGAEHFYKRLCQEILNNFDWEEGRIQVNNAINQEIPILWHYVLKALTDEGGHSKENGNGVDTFKKLINDVKQAIILLDADSENDLTLLFPNQEEGYLERLYRYSAVYDLHQYDVNGMLFLIKRIITAFPDGIENHYGVSSMNLYQILESIVGKSQVAFLKNGACVMAGDEFDHKTKDILDKMVANKSLNKKFVNPLQWNLVDDDSEWIIKRDGFYYILPPVMSMLGIYDKIGRALGWKDFGPQIETAVIDLFSGVEGVNVYSGKYLFENEVFECDAIILGQEYALLVECKKKGISRQARGGDKLKALEDLSQTYFSSQKQAYHTHRAILDNNRKLELYPAEYDISAKNSHNEKYKEHKQTVDFSHVNRFIRISCTGGSFWITGEVGIAGNIERQIDMGYADYSVNGYIADFVEERDKLLGLIGNDSRAVKLDRLFMSFDKLYDLVIKLQVAKKTGDSLLASIWKMTRVQSKKNDTANHLSWFIGNG